MPVETLQKTIRAIAARLLDPVLLLVIALLGGFGMLAFILFRALGS